MGIASEFIVKPHAAPSELSSPFYQRNEHFCQQVEVFILSRKGSVAGRYNAFSYFVKGTITGNRTWKVLYRLGHELNPSFAPSREYRMIEWSTKLSQSDELRFEIHPFSLYEFVKSLFLFHLSFRKFQINGHSYIVRSNRASKEFTSRLSSILDLPLRRNEVVHVKLKKGDLQILLWTDQHYFEELDELIQSL